MFIHLDIDCFFVSAERTLNKSLLDIPVAVGGRSSNDIFSSKKIQRTIVTNRAAFSSKILSNDTHKSFKEYFIDENGRIRGIITTCSYEARKFGVKTAMSVNEALRLCPKLKMIPPNYSLYDELSNKLKDLLEKEVPLIEQYSIDEFFCDVSGYIKEDEILEFAHFLKKKILDELDLPISIGIASTKYLSKLMTEYAKPNGIKYVSSQDMPEFTKDIPIENFSGIGKALCEKLKGYNINTLGDIRKNQKLFYSWQKSGIDLYNRVCGIRDNKLTIQRERKSLGIGRSFDVVFDRNEVRRRVMILSRYLSFIIKKEKVNPLSYSILIRYEYGIKVRDYINVNRLFNEVDFKAEMIKLFEVVDSHKTHGVIQLYITVFNFAKSNDFTANLFDYEEEIKKQALTNQMQKLRLKYGVDIVKSAFEI
ncbi:DNA polymerase IV [Aliarcobacter butzleri]|uniref:Y-family DNA polymerase n=1 Tax=Aliarcobacter butzleri TaxID=28197 RepID=UPI0012605580|nr:DNA polymerase IV [Aliarcobacter butzleri]MCG3675853.1 DNA polymerase IV [Aliarcobacter butzleri]MCG3704773.1 DNA polymerase IV [Aliarcobacter butzleri]MCT7551064.1 DNA polymerase IV [Aliarcobacter butzleri]MCT7560174.1 DNA polymerase IV [Aliarcobacter butzleri]MCT7626894.1 DNA polymerase IV [Aliarcobacter butzleri]